jgi:hypothetical protein
VKIRVEVKIFVSEFLQKSRENFFFAFCEKSLQKVMQITKVFAKNGAGSENAVKNPNS